MLTNLKSTKQRFSLEKGEKGDEIVSFFFIALAVVAPIIFAVQITLRIEDSLEKQLQYSGIIDRNPSISFEVSGENILIAGTASHEQQVMDLEKELTQLPDVKRVLRKNINVIPIYPVQSPYTFEVRLERNHLAVKGFMPTPQSKEALEEAIETEMQSFSVSPEITLASGEPDRLWPVLVQRALKLIPFLESGVIRLKDKTLILEGTTSTEEMRLELLQEAQIFLPEHFSLEDDQLLSSELLNNSSTYKIRFSKSAQGELSYSATLPDQQTYRQTLSILQETFKRSLPKPLQINYITGQVPDHWDKEVLLFTAFLASKLYSGQVSLDGRILSVQGILTDPKALELVRKEQKKLPLYYHLDFSQASFLQ